MLFELLATLAAGIAAGGTIAFLRRVAKIGLPGWLTPVVAAVAMFSMMIWNDYSWFDRTEANLAEGIEVAATYESSTIFQPWTMLRPRVSRFVAVDRGAMTTPEGLPDIRLADAVLVERYDTPARVPQVFDCAAGRRGDPTGTVAPAADGSGAATGVDWHAPDPADPLIATACRPA